MALEVRIRISLMRGGYKRKINLERKRDVLSGKIFRGRSKLKGSRVRRTRGIILFYFFEGEEKQPPFRVLGMRRLPLGEESQGIWVDWHKLDS